MVTELVQALTAVKNTTDIVKLISEYSKEIDDKQKYSEFMRCISNLNLEIAKTEDALSKQIRESTKLEEKIAELEKENQKLKNPSVLLVKRGKLYYVGDAEDPICPNCHKKGDEVIMSNIIDMVFTCSQCQHEIIDI
jgi:hypothetical protein